MLKHIENPDFFLTLYPKLCFISSAVAFPLKSHCCLLFVCEELSPALPQTGNNTDTQI